MSRTLSRLIVALAMVVAFARSSSAEIGIDPAEPVAREPFSIRYDGVWNDSCVPSNPRLEVRGAQLIVTFAQEHVESCLTVLTPYTATIEGVRLEGGSYSLLTRLDAERLRPLFDEKQFHVSGAWAPIEMYPNIDATTGNRTVSISGSFPCSDSECSPPQVFFGATPSPNVRRQTEGTIHAVTPPGQGIVDVTVRGENYTYTKVAALQYVDREDWESLLLPVYAGDGALGGAYGSLWETDWSVLNQNEVPLLKYVDLFYSDESCPVLCPGPEPLNPGVVDPYFRMLLPYPRNDVPAALLHVRKEAAEHVTGELRVRDLTRQAESWGCEIPIVRESRMTSVVTLVDVPRDERFRQRLRIYNPRLSDLRVKVEFFAFTGERLAEREIVLAWPEGSQGSIDGGYIREGSEQFPLQPAFAELDLLSVTELAGHPTIWIRATSQGGQKIWAFVSITNNETQQVSIVTPQ